MMTIRAPQWLKNLVGDFFANLVSFIGSAAFKMTLWLLAPILAPLYLVYGLMQFINAKFQAVMQVGLSPGGMVTSLSAGSMLSMANAFFPIDDVAILLPILVSLMAAAYGYRLVKSFIPTLS